MKRIGIWGSTGSIGRQALKIVSENRKSYCVEFLSCRRDISTLAKQIVEFQPKAVSVESREAMDSLRRELFMISEDIMPEILFGEHALVETMKRTEAEMILNALVGISGMMPTAEAIENGIDIALANKETLVAGGEIIMRKAKEKGVKIFPVDSEHSAIYQSIKGSRREDVRKVILTGSGGPFRGMSKDELNKATLEQALNHPRWDMGAKITIDSATLMNKGLEVIEASELFGLKNDEIEVVIHPQSIIHSMVEFKDGAIIAELSEPDMRQPIAYAFDENVRRDFGGKRLNLFELEEGISFERPDMETFRCLKLAVEANERGGSLPTIMNGANEIAVEAFLNEKISFVDIPRLVDETMNKMDIEEITCLEQVEDIDKRSRNLTEAMIRKL